MSNTSATGGYLTLTSLPVTDRDLSRLVHDVLAGVTGLNAELVRPAWQVNAPIRPLLDVLWCAYSIVNRTTEAGTAWQQWQSATGSQLQRMESFDVVASFYGPDCQTYAGILRDGLELSQNREQLALLAVTYAYADQIVHVPELVNDRWYDRADIMLHFRRTIKNTYAILNLTNASGNYTTDAGLSGSWTTQEL